jgi:hypothetical protein
MNKKETEVSVPDELVINKIYFIREHKVMYLNELIEKKEDQKTRKTIGYKIPKKKK